MAGFETQGEARQGTGELRLVRGEQKGTRKAFTAGLGEVASQPVEHGVGGGDVEIGEGLVEQQEVGGGEQDAGKRGALAHALGVFAEPAGIAGIERDLREGGGDALAPGLWGEGGFVQTEEVIEVFGGGEVVIQHGAVAHVSDAAAELARGPAEDGDGSVGGVGEAGEKPQESGFAGAV